MHDNIATLGQTRYARRRAVRYALGYAAALVLVAIDMLLGNSILWLHVTIGFFAAWKIGEWLDEYERETKKHRKVLYQLRSGRPQ